MSTASPVYTRLLGLADNPTYVGRTLTYVRGTHDPVRGPIERLSVQDGKLQLRTSWLEAVAGDGTRMLWVDHPSTFELGEDECIVEIKNNGSVVLTGTLGFHAEIDYTGSRRLTSPPARP